MSVKSKIIPYLCAISVNIMYACLAALKICGCCYNKAAGSGLHVVMIGTMSGGAHQTKEKVV